MVEAKQCLPHSPSHPVPRLVKEEELKTLKWDLEEIQRTRTELMMKLRKKQWEWESCVMERDQHAAAVEKVKIKLNRKANELTESWAREKALQSKVSQLQEQVRDTARCVRGVGCLEGIQMVFAVALLFNVWSHRSPFHSLYNLFTNVFYCTYFLSSLHPSSSNIPFYFLSASSCILTSPIAVDNIPLFALPTFLKAR